MKTKFVKQFLTAALAATLAFTSVVLAYAAEDTELLQEITVEPPEEDAEVLDNNEEIVFDNNGETPVQNVPGDDDEQNEQNVPADLIFDDEQSVPEELTVEDEDNAEDELWKPYPKQRRMAL